MFFLEDISFYFWKMSKRATIDNCWGRMQHGRESKSCMC